MIVFALILAPSAAYVGAYYWLPDSTMSDDSSAWRCYRHRWQASLFQPAASAESWLTGRDIKSICVSEILYEVPLSD